MILNLILEGVGYWNVNKSPFIVAIAHPDSMLILLDDCVHGALHVHLHVLNIAAIESR